MSLHAGYLAILAAADTLGCWRWLLDLPRHEELVAPKLTTWLNTDFFSVSPSALPNRYALPSLILPLRTAQEQADSSTTPIRTSSHPSQDYRTVLFTNEDSAYQWLAH